MCLELLILSGAFESAGAISRRGRKPYRSLGRQQGEGQALRVEFVASFARNSYYSDRSCPSAESRRRHAERPRHVTS
jgi:hypothetical protein